MGITSPAGCQWVPRQQSTGLDGRSQGPLVLSFAGCQKYQISLSQNALAGNQKKYGGVFTNTIKTLLQTLDGALAPTQERLLSIRNVFGMHVVPGVAQRIKGSLIVAEQDLMVTSNNNEIDLTKISFPDLFNGSISREDGTIQPKYCIDSDIQKIITMDVED